MSVVGDLLIMSVEQTRGRLDCGLQGVAEPVSAERFRGIRIFDISDLRMPRQVAAVQTCRGSHTHTVVTDPDEAGNIYVYGAGTAPVRSGDELAGCSDEPPSENPDTALFRIDVIRVPLASPEGARIVSRPAVFQDPDTGALAGLWRGGDHGPGTQRTAESNRCHDITAFAEVGLAAGACSGNGILLDISDPVNPARIDEVVDPGFAYWHSATFNNDGTKVIFTHEWGGGGRPRCRASDPREWGANAIFDIVDGRMQFRSYYKLPAPQTERENCVAHNGSLVPVPGRDIIVQAWYQGGISVFDFTDSSNPVEIAFFDRGPIDAERFVMGGFWSSYWYRGYIYGTEIARGLDVLELLPSEHLTENEIAAAAAVTPAAFNAQQQRRIDWPPRSVGRRCRTCSAVSTSSYPTATRRSGRSWPPPPTKWRTPPRKPTVAAGNGSGRWRGRCRALPNACVDLVRPCRPWYPWSKKSPTEPPPPRGRGGVLPSREVSREEVEHDRGATRRRRFIDVRQEEPPHYRGHAGVGGRGRGRRLDHQLSLRGHPGLRPAG